jgi:hypothetical protein
MPPGALAQDARQREIGLGSSLASAIGTTIWLAYCGLLASALLAGWIYRGEGHLTAEHGTGYWLGIASATALALLTIYPLRKRMRRSRILGTVPFWFRLHMAFGLLAPTLVLLHCNFRAGSANSSAALFSMLIVATSGLIGRYLYVRVYRNMLGHKRNALSYFVELSDLSQIPVSGEELVAIRTLTEQATTPRRSLWSALSMRQRNALAARRMMRKLRRAVHQRIKAETSTLGQSWREQRRRRNRFEVWSRAYLSAIRKAGSLAVNERLFALWHVLHLPLFILLIIALVAHVIAVHLY